MNLTELVTIAEYIGIITFAFSGVAVGIKAKMDIFGIMVLGFVTALGGGLIRDILLNNVPIALTSNFYFIITLVSIGFAITLLPLKVSIRNSVIHAADAIGTGAFAVTGVVIGSNEMLNWVPCLALGMVTATGGGVLRDILASRIPKVLSTQLNATGSLIGGSVTLLLIPYDLELAVLVGAICTAVIVWIGHKGWLSVPSLH